MIARRTLAELIESDAPAWPLVSRWIRAATNRAEVLPASDPARSEALLAAQVSTRSPLGAVIYETGGLLVDHGWLRVLGSGHPRLPRSLPGWNWGRSVTREDEPPPFVLVADDIVGGFFALDGGALGPGHHHACYFAPDTLAWEAMEEMTYSQLLVWILSGDLARFYQSLRWPGWQDEVALIGGDQCLSIAPPLWTHEGRDIAAASRRPVPVSEIYSLYVG
ncbi:MAG: DUF2625 domain-containing protein [Armatimonadetes bacterium]|nr:DUF2625 domain-containing protein [Armatimonadota bacterium]